MFFEEKKRVFERGTLKNQTCTRSSLVQHEKLTLYANFHALPQKRQVLYSYFFNKRMDYKRNKSLCSWKQPKSVILTTKPKSVVLTTKPRSNCFEGPSLRYSSQSGLTLGYFSRRVWVLSYLNRVLKWSRWLQLNYSTKKVYNTEFHTQSDFFCPSKKAAFPKTSLYFFFWWSRKYSNLCLHSMQKNKNRILTRLWKLLRESIALGQLVRSSK